MKLMLKNMSMTFAKSLALKLIESWKTMKIIKEQEKEL